ncbi:MAG: ferritin family protein [Anaerolineae bacterium]
MTQQTKQEAVRALQWAAATEWYGHRFYTAAARQTKADRGQEFFHSLARDESEHLHIILAELEALKAGRGWLTYEEAIKTPVEFDITGPNPFPEAAEGMEMLFPSVKEVGGVVDQVATDVAALGLALEFERRGYEMYTRQAELATDEKARQAYKILAKEENRHYTWIQGSLDYLTHNETWWDQEEFPFFEG